MTLRPYGVLSVTNDKKSLLIVYHSQGGTMRAMAESFARGVAQESSVRLVIKEAKETTLADLLECQAIAIGSPEYFGTMAGMIKDFFDRTFEGAREKTVGLPYVLFVCAGNDGRGAITQIERIVAGYKWQKVQEHIRVVGSPTREDVAKLEELGNTLAAGLDFGIY